MDKEGIIVDTREKNPWDFDIHGIDSMKRKLDAGDYSLEGYEDRFAIERKASVAEIATNFCRTRKTFMRAIDRLLDCEYPYLVLEFSEEDVKRYPEGCGMSRAVMNKIRVSGNYILSQIRRLESRGIMVVFAGDKENAERIAFDIINEFYEEIKDGD